MIRLFLFVSTLLISRDFGIKYCSADNMLHFLLVTSYCEALLDLSVSFSKLSFFLWTGNDCLFTPSGL